jgi:hypothetical protein
MQRQELRKMRPNLIPADEQTVGQSRQKHSVICVEPSDRIGVAGRESRVPAIEQLRDGPSARLGA